MEERRFEKQVKHQMDELKIQPSEEVWQKVAANIKEKKHSHWTILFLLFILLGSGYLFWRSMQQRVSMNNNLAKNTGNTFLVTKKNIPPSHKLLDENKKKSQLFNNKNSKYDSSGQVISISKKSEHNIGLSHSNQHSSFVKKHVADSKTIIDIATSGIEENKKKDKTNSTLPKASKPETGKYSTDTLNNSASIKLSKDSLLHRFTVNNLDTSTPKAIISKLSHRKNKWKLGVTITPGISFIKDAFFKTNNTPYSVPTTAGSSAYNPTTYYGKFHPGFGCIVGVFAEKNISKRLKFDVGINYKLLSVSNSFTDSVLQYYSSKHISRFNNIELPLSLKYIFNTRSLPLYIQSGITLSQLLGNSSYNKTHVNFTSSLGVTFFSKLHHPVSFGPFINYQDGSLANTGLYYKKQILFTGLHADIIL